MTHTLRRTADLYTSGYKPPGVQPDWERCSMTLDSTNTFLGARVNLLGAPVKDAVAWFDGDGRCRILVADSAARRMTLRMDKTGRWTASATPLTGVPA